MMLIREEGPTAAGTKIYTFSDQSSVEVPARYKVGEVVGRGAYGIVCSAVDTESGEMLAIKKVPRLFSDPVDGKRVLREVKALNFLRHPNIISLRDVFYNGPAESFAELYIVTELMETDMRKMLGSPRLRMGCGHCQYFTLQLLCALQYTHSAHIIHRDLKPANLLADSDCNLKLCDYGLSRGYYGSRQQQQGAAAAATNGGGSGCAAGNNDRDGGEAKEMTNYVVTRFYRPPELLLVCGRYDYAVDMWGAGCLAAELVSGKPLIAGRDYIHQLNLIVELLGLPDIARDLPDCTSTEALEYVQSLPPVRRRPLAEFCPQLHDRFHDPSFLNSFDDGTPPPQPEEAFRSFESFLFGLLKYRPAARLTAKEAIAHEWLGVIRGGQTEMEGCEAPQAYHWGFDDKAVTVQELRPMFIKEVEDFHASGRGCRAVPRA